MDKNSEVEPKVVETDKDAINGQTKCPKCGATDISTNLKTGLLRCNFCRHEFEPEKFDEMETDISNLEGEIITSGTQDIDENAGNIVTLKCTSCGAEVVIDASESTQARCHWCRNMLSINQQVPNGAVPDMTLPFKLTKKEAQTQIEEFVGKRKFFANPKFKEEFTTDNIMGFYFPYMVVDINSHANFTGEGEHETRRYTVKRGDNSETRYDADVYAVERDFDLTINGLTVESSKERLSKDDSTKTNNIINSIMPFDIENCVKWDSNYLRGFSSEKRDINIDELKPIVKEQAKDIARYAINDTLKFYDRGVCWRNEELTIKGQQWKSAYLPVWLYSYQEKKKNGKNLLHYVAVNARTKETMGSIPIHMPKLIGAAAIVELIGFIASLFIKTNEDNAFWPLWLAGIIYYFIIYGKYRNKNARHNYENETKKEKTNVIENDKFIQHRHGLSRSEIDGKNNERLGGSTLDLGQIGNLLR